MSGQKLIALSVFVLLAGSCAPKDPPPHDPGPPDPDLCVKTESKVLFVLESSNRMKTPATGETEIIHGFFKCFPNAKWYKTGKHWWQGFWGCEVATGPSKWEVATTAIQKTVPHYKKYSDFAMLTYPVQQDKKCHGFFCKFFKMVRCKRHKLVWVPCTKTKIETYPCQKTKKQWTWCFARCGMPYMCQKTVTYTGTCTKQVQYQGTCLQKVVVWDQCKKPVDKTCMVPDVQVEFGSPPGQFTSHLSQKTPGGSAPTESALQTALQYFEQFDPAGQDRHVILITDGNDTCGDDPVPAVQELRAAGIDVWVMAFQTSGDQAILDSMADSGGHPLAGSTNKYRTLGGSSDLAAVLDEIINKPGSEVCDGLDNDCDGHTDEDLVRQCPQQCGGGVQFCKNGVWGGCVDPNSIEGDEIPDVAPELCDGVDNDCDGETDEDFDVNGACVKGNGACQTTGILVCSADGTGVECDAPEPLSPEPEQCDGMDNDCDGEIDEGLVRDCSNGCGTGTQACIGGEWGDCQITKPSPELCDGLDNDCDGLTDEGFDVGQACVAGADGCQVQGTLVCTADGLGVECDAGGDLGSGLEICNGLDDDCDGIPDNGSDLCPAGQVCFKGQCVYD